MALFNRRRTGSTSSKSLVFPAGKTSSTSSGVKKEADTRVILNKQRRPFDSLRMKGIYHDDDSRESLSETRRLCRDYAKFHDLIPMILTIYAQFPLQGMRIVGRNEKETRLFEEQFFDRLDYKSYLVEVGKEFFKIGEVNSFGIFDYTTREWVSEEILDPDTVFVESSLFAGEDVVSISISDELRAAIESGTGNDLDYIKETYPDIVDAVNTNRNIRLNDEFIFRMIDRAEPWDNYGTPIMTRAFDALLREESLNAAQDAVADRLYSPLILAKLGLSANDIGGEQPQAWIPTQGQLDQFGETFDQTLAADFRVIIHHMGIDIKSVFGRESMPNMEKDFDRVEKKIMRAFGIGQGLLDGSNNGAYASSAINRDFISQLMATYQRNIRALFRKRAEVFCRERGIYETVKGDKGKDIIKTRTVYTRDSNGEKVSYEEPIVFVPELEFATDPMKDSSFEINLLSTLSKAGVPISQRTFIEASGKEIDLDIEHARIQEEAINDRLAEVSLEEELNKALENRKLEPEEMAQVDKNIETLVTDTGRIDTDNLEDMEQETNTYKPTDEGIE